MQLVRKPERGNRGRPNPARHRDKAELYRSPDLQRQPQEEGYREQRQRRSGGLCDGVGRKWKEVGPSEFRSRLEQRTKQRDQEGEGRA